MRYVVVTRLPFEHEPQLSDKEIVEKNLFTNNVGNLFFTNSVIRTLLKPGNEIVRYKKGLDLNSFTEVFDNYSTQDINKFKSIIFHYITEFQNKAKNALLTEKLRLKKILDNQNS